MVQFHLMKREPDRPRAHRVYSMMRNLGIAFWVTVTAVVVCVVDDLPREPHDIMLSKVVVA